MENGDKQWIGTVLKAVQSRSRAQSRRLLGRRRDFGKATGNEQAEAEGAAEKAEGNVQSGVGKAKGRARNALKKKPTLSVVD
jgi:hypothetical protein